MRLSVRWSVNLLTRVTSLGVLFFNNAGYLKMCGHGTIGLAVTLHHLGKIEVGAHSFETPVGIVDFELKSPNVVTIRNVPSYRFRKEVQVEVPEIGIVTGDIAWGGNWFFLVRDARHELHVKNLDLLLDDAKKIKAQLGEDGITGESGAEIDHVEFFGAAPCDVGQQSQFCTLSWWSLRSFALWDRNQRQACLPGGRWQVTTGRSLGSGEHCGQRV